jgi:hypothetical protein
MTILQSRLSGMYFKDFGLWVAHVAEALHFESMETAKHFVTAERLSDVALRSVNAKGER